MTLRAWLLATLVLSLSFAPAYAQNLSFGQALLAAQSSPSVALAQARLELTIAQLAAASGIISMQLSTGYSYSWNSIISATAELSESRRSDTSPITLSASFNVIPYGPSYEALVRAQWAVKEAELGLRDAHHAAVVAVAQRYLTVLRSQQEVDLRTQEVAQAELRLEAARARFEVGAFSESQLLDAELALSEAQNTLASAFRQHAQALATLSNTLGMTVGEVSGEAPTAVLSELDDLLDNLEIQFLNRSDVARAEIGVQRAELAVASAWRESLPSGSLSMQYSTASSNQSLSAGANFDTRTFQPSMSLAYDPTHDPPAGLPSDSWSQSFSLGLSVTIPLDSSSSATLLVAELGLVQARLQAQQTLNQARLELDNSRRELEAAQASVALSQQVTVSRELAAQTARQRLELGLATELDLRQAELNVLSAQLGLQRAQDALLIAHMTLLQALGMDPWEVF